MKKLVANMFIALAVIGGIPSLGFAAVKETNKTVNVDQPADYGDYRIWANSTQTHKVFLYAGSARISIIGDGTTDLDLYVYELNGNLISSRESYGDDETSYLSIYKSGYFLVKVVNRGRVYNEYSIFID